MENQQPQKIMIMSYGAILGDVNWEDLKDEKSTLPVIRPAPQQQFYPVSLPQKRFYVIDRQFGGLDTSYNTPQALIIEGQFDKDRAASALCAMVERHEVFRTTFEFIDGEPIQKVQAKVDFQMDYLECESGNESHLIKNLIKPFDLSKAPLLRAAVIKLSADKYILLFDMHHILSDDVSLSIFTYEFFMIYSGIDLPENKIQFKDFTIWLNHLLQNNLLKRQEDFWVNMFSDGIPVLNLPYDYEKPKIQRYEGDKVVFSAEEDLSLKLNELSRKTKTGIYIVLLAAYYVLLAKATGQDDLVVGTIVSGRSVKEIENTLGMFANMLPLRNFPAADKSFNEFLEEIKLNTANAYINQDYPFERLVDQLGIRRNPASNPLFDTMFLVPYFNIPPLEAGDLKISQFNNDNTVAKIDLRLISIAMEKEIGFILEYRMSLFKKETIQRMSVDYLQILKAITLDKNVKLGEIKLGYECKKIEKAIAEDFEFDF